MISITFVFYMFVILTTVIGTARGWAKELLVVVSAILGLFVIMILESYIGVYQQLMLTSPSSTQFWSRTMIILLLAFFGYQTPNIKVFQTAARREKVRDAVLGGVVGALNGYLVVGSVWWFLDKVGYQTFPNVVLAPDPTTAMGATAIRLLDSMAPALLMQAPHIYIAIAVAFTFVVIVYI